MSGSEVLRYTDAEIRKGGELLKYPVTKLQKVLRFPFGLYFNNNTYFRALSITLCGIGYLWCQVSKKVNSPDNKAKYKKIHLKRLRTRFDPIHE